MLLVGVSGPDDSGFVERFAGNLHPDGQSAFREAARHRDSGQAGDIERRGKAAAPDSAGGIVAGKSGGRLGHSGGHQQVDFLENLGELPPGPSADTLGLQVVGGGQQRADTEAAADDVAKVLRAGFEVRFVVGVSLTDHDDRVGGADVVQAGQGDFLYPGAQAFQLGYGALNDSDYFGVDAGVIGVKEVVARQADFHAANVLPQRKGVVWHRSAAGCGVFGVIAGDGLEHISGVLYGPGHWAGVVL